jgi:hypothetical protein
VHGLPALVMSSAAALTMTIGALVLRADTDDDDRETGSRDLSVAAVLLDTFADAAAAAGIAATGGIILATRWLVLARSRGCACHRRDRRLPRRHPASQDPPPNPTVPGSGPSCSEPSGRAGMSTSLADFPRWRRTRLRTAQLSPQ